MFLAIYSYHVAVEEEGEAMTETNAELIAKVRERLTTEKPGHPLDGYGVASRSRDLSRLCDALEFAGHRSDDPPCDRGPDCYSCACDAARAAYDAAVAAREKGGE